MLAFKFSETDSLSCERKEVITLITHEGEHYAIDQIKVDQRKKINNVLCGGLVSYREDLSHRNIKSMKVDVLFDMID